MKESVSVIILLPSHIDRSLCILLVMISKIFLLLVALCPVCLCGSTAAKPFAPAQDNVTHVMPIANANGPSVLKDSLTPQDVFHEKAEIKDERRESSTQPSSSSTDTVVMDPSDDDKAFTEMDPSRFDQKATTAAPAVPSNATAEGYGSSATRDSAGCIIILLICASVFL